MACEVTCLWSCGMRFEGRSTAGMPGCERGARRGSIGD
jgi:hypothetical protein